MKFENFQIDTNLLPELESLKFEALEKNLLKIELISTTIFALVLIGGMIVFVNLNQFIYPTYYDYLVASFVFLLILFIYYVVIAGFRKKAYALRERDLLYKTGLWWKSLTSIPFNRVQHCEVKQGPLERWYGLAQLCIYTAGGSQSDVKIPGLNLSKANAVKQFILNQTTIDEEE